MSTFGMTELILIFIVLFLALPIWFTYKIISHRIRNRNKP